MTNHFYSRTYLAAAAISLLIGCGGGGGSPVHPATMMRANTVGDSWVYDVSTTLPGLGNGSGTYTQELLSSTYLGRPSIADEEIFDLPSYPNGPVVLSDYTESSLTGVLLAVISQGILTPVKSDTFSVGPTIDSTTVRSGVLTLSDGTVQSENYQVVGAERVTVPAGTFNCWVVNMTSSRQDGTRDFYSLYVDPTLGNWVKADVQILYGGGQQFLWHAQLKSMVTAKSSAASPLIGVIPPVQVPFTPGLMMPLEHALPQSGQ